ncbi:pentapeptide repeat-containing protein [Amycolatopsis sp. NPDC051045]|uniref:pentapeptide repeat-containing protein n=1 Tax=Amycolatopsis sp. NPDC051045 TaxID=3156922 RepID=UPI00342014D0
MSTVTPFPVLALIGAVSGSVTAWLLLRRDRPVQVLTPSAPPERVPPEVAAQLLADERAERLAALGRFAEAADADPELRQDCADEIVAHLSHYWSDWPAWQAQVWEFLLPHLNPTSSTFWPGIDLHVENLTLFCVDLRGCEVRDAVFREVRFGGDARFDEAVFTGSVSFEGARFARHAFFGGASFETGADFEDAVFTGTAAFDRSTAHGQVWFDAARFSAHTDFAATGFGDDVSFDAAGFAGRTSFRGTRFAADALFTRARFSGHADFTAATAAVFDFTGARARTDVRVLRTWPPAWAPGEPRRRRPGWWAEVTTPA